MRQKKAQRLVSMFAATGNAKEAEPDGEPPTDNAKMERAMDALAGEAEHIDEHNPKDAAKLLKKFSDMTGMELRRKHQRSHEPAGIGRRSRND